MRLSGQERMSLLEYNDWNQSRFEGLLRDITRQLSETPEVAISFEQSRPESFQHFVIDELDRQGYVAYFENAMPSGSLRLVAKRRAR
jgi:hypothetical protein